MASATPAERLAAEDEAAYLHVARQLLGRGVRTLGLMPASRDVDVPELARRLGRALAKLSELTIVVVALRARFSDACSESASGDPIIGTWLAPRLALIAPAQPASAGRRAAQVVSIVSRATARNALVLVDLSALDESQEQLAVIDELDAACIVARAHATRRRDLLRCRGQLRPSADLGVLIVDS